MVDLLSFITADSLVPVDSDNHEEVVRSLIDRCLSGHSEQIRAAVVREIRAKRGWQEVNLGGGFAISHARSDEVEDIRMAVGLLRRKIRYLKGPPVKTVFCVVLPNSESRLYLSLMARLTRLVSRPEVARVFHAGDTEAILRAVRRFQEV